MFAHDMEFKKYDTLNSQHVSEIKRALYYGVRNPYATKKDLKVGDFKDDIHWAATVADTAEQRKRLREVADRYGLEELNTRYVSSTNEIVFHMLLGEGYSIMDSYVLQDTPKDIKILPLDELDPVKVSLFWDKSNMNPCIPLFCDEMKQYVN